ncbi:30S ribosomal protein S8 [Chloroflexota bacterium]
MTISDPIADMLTRIRNAIMARHNTVPIPTSRMKLSIARILKEEGFIDDYEVIGNTPHRSIRIKLKYYENNEPAISGLERVSKPGLRVYIEKKEISRVHGGLGVAILSTSRGIRTGHQAWRLGTGGEVLCNIW